MIIQLLWLSLNVLYIYCILNKAIEHFINNTDITKIPGKAVKSHDNV